MFTGLIQHLGRVSSAHPSAVGQRMEVDLSGWKHTPEPGESISINGCCLTVAAVHDGLADFDVIPETLRRTTLGALQAGAAVNLEHAATVQSLLGGHVVQGHVDGVGVVRAVDDAGAECRVRIEVPEDLQDFVVFKGSIAVEGVSLTVAARRDDWFEVALIPETLNRTTLGSLAVGDRLNLEADYLARIVVSWLERRAGHAGE